MAELSQRLPRLAYLLMFEAAARHRSFTRAAEELGVTQAAVSQQVKLLERALGVGLFVRLHRGIELTRAGTRLHRAVVMGLEHIAETAENVRRQERTPAINIGVTFAVAMFWLVPRLPQFRARHPDLDIHIIASDRGFETVADQVDAGIAYGGDGPVLRYMPAAGHGVSRLQPSLSAPAPPDRHSATHGRNPVVT